MHSKYEEGYAIGYRQGMASVAYKIAEKLYKKQFRDSFRKNKMLFRWLSEYEMEIVMDSLLKTSSIDAVNEFLFASTKTQFIPHEDIV